MKCGNVKKAKQLLERSAEIYRYNYAHNDNLDNAQIFSSLGTAYLMEGHNLIEAEQLLYKSLKIFQAEQHPDAYISLENLSLLYVIKALKCQEQNDFVQYKNLKLAAVRYLLQASEIVDTNFSDATNSHNKRIQGKLNILRQGNLADLQKMAVTDLQNTFVVFE
jgi:hypothetical protein